VPADFHARWIPIRDAPDDPIGLCAESKVFGEGIKSTDADKKSARGREGNRVTPIFAPTARKIEGNRNQREIKGSGGGTEIHVTGTTRSATLTRACRLSFLAFELADTPISRLSVQTALSFFRPSGRATFVAATLLSPDRRPNIP